MQEASVVATELARRIHKAFRRNRLLVLGVTGGVALLFLAIIVAAFAVRGERQANCVFRIPRNANQVITKGDARVLDGCMEIGDTFTSNASQTLGLSGRESLPHNQAALFAYGEPDEYCMWMKEMKFSLDVLWLNAEKQIIHKRENLPPGSYPQAFCGPKETHYILEVNAGMVAAADLRVGQRLNF